MFGTRCERFNRLHQVAVYGVPILFTAVLEMHGNTQALTSRQAYHTKRVGSPDPWSVSSIILVRLDIYSAINSNYATRRIGNEPMIKASHFTTHPAGARSTCSSFHILPTQYSVLHTIFRVGRKKRLSSEFGRRTFGHLPKKRKINKK